MDSGDITGWAIIAICAGIFGFINGFRQLKAKRLIQNIPTSKISTGAVGSNVEIKGKVLCQKEKLIKGPVSGKLCAFYSLEIQKLVRTKDSSYWKKIDQFFSDEGFYVDDNSGANALVFVKGADIKLKGNTDDFRVRSNSFSSIPQSLRSALTEHKKEIKRFKLKETSWFFSNEYRFVEWRFHANESVYVIGYAESGLKVSKRNKLKMKFYMLGKKKLAANPKWQQKFDANKDGKMSHQELEWGAKVIGKKLQSKYSPEEIAGYIPKTKMLFKKRKPNPFIISNKKEDEIVKSLSMWSTVQIWGGPALVVGGAWGLMSVWGG